MGGVKRELRGVGYRKKLVKPVQAGDKEERNRFAMVFNNMPYIKKEMKKYASCGMV